MFKAASREKNSLEPDGNGSFTEDTHCGFGSAHMETKNCVSPCPYFFTCNAPEEADQALQFQEIDVLIAEGTVGRRARQRIAKC